jgi:Asp-tRNA(Asn)/Glu-tRNA(Gln) amidotransferase C subunit
VVLATLFSDKDKNRRLLLPLPKIPLLFLSNAYDQHKLSTELLPELKKLIDLSIREDKDHRHMVYRFLGHKFSSITSLFSAVEAFINESIPAEEKYELKDGTIWTRDDIQRFMNCEDKIKKLMPYLFAPKTYAKHQPQKKEPLMRLKKIRDEIVHMKPLPNTSIELKTIIHGYHDHAKLLQQVYKFNFNEAYETVAEFMNFYSPGYVEECLCGVDY